MELNKSSECLLPFCSRYGDKAPRSFPARLLTILWMITGTIVTSLFTANVTTVLTTKNVAALQNVLGQKVMWACGYNQQYIRLTFNSPVNAVCSYFRGAFIKSKLDRTACK